MFGSQRSSIFLQSHSHTCYPGSKYFSIFLCCV